MSLPSLTPTAEYIDMLYMRCLHELAPIAGLKWCVVLTPPGEDDEGTGTIRLRGEYNGEQFDSDANMHAVQIGARASIEAMETVTNHHLNKFMEAIPR
jgi:hypothetical protein